MKVILIGIVLFVLPLFALYYAVVGSLGIALAMAVVMVIAGFVFSSVSGYMAGLVGSSNNPVSGITISTILFASLILLALMGKGSTVGPVAAIMIGAVICCAAAVAGDNLQDLKAGQLVGATPWRQQVMLGIGAIASAAIMAPVLNLLLDAYGIGTPAREGVNALAAPQAKLMAAVASGIFGEGLPWDMVAIGAAVGALVITLDEYLKRSGKSWRAPVLAVAVGIYLPLELSTPIFVGGLIAELATRFHRRRNPGGDPELLKQMGLLFAAGLIAGEAIVGVLIAIPIVASGDADVLAVAENMRPGAVGRARRARGDGWWMYSRRHAERRRRDLIEGSRLFLARRASRNRIFLALAIIYVVWGTSYIATKVMVTDEPPLFAAGLRFTLAGILLTAFSCFRYGRPKLARRGAAAHPRHGLRSPCCSATPAT